jgi:hypothetical protein
MEGKKRSDDASQRVPETLKYFLQGLASKIIRNSEYNLQENIP